MSSYALSQQQSGSESMTDAGSATDTFAGVNQGNGDTGTGGDSFSDSNT